jgi:hypothetical protein
MQSKEAAVKELNTKHAVCLDIVGSKPLLTKRLIILVKTMKTADKLP